MIPYYASPFPHTHSCYLSTFFFPFLFLYIDYHDNPSSVLKFTSCAVIVTQSICIQVIEHHFSEQRIYVMG